MTEITTLRDAVAALVHDGDTVAMEGFTHLIPTAAGHELVRQGKERLRLVRLTPDIVFDQLIGMGCADTLVFSWGGNPGVGSLHRLRDAVERSWPRPLQLEEYTHAALTNAYVAGASGLPFAVVSEYPRGDHYSHGRVRELACPFTGAAVNAVAAVKPDVTIIHAQQADRSGNVMLWGISGVQREAVMAARRSVVTVEEVVEELSPRMNAVVLPALVVDAVAAVPGGAHPSYAQDYTDRDNDFYRAWDAIAADRDRFTAWMREHVLDTADWTEYRRRLAGAAAGQGPGR